MKIALIIVNAQADYLPKGKAGTNLIRHIEYLAGDQKPDLIIATRNWFPVETKLSHGVENTPGAKLVPSIKRLAHYVVSILHPGAFSAFEGSTLRPLRPLEDILEDHQIQEIIVTGTCDPILTCTALDAAALGYFTRVDRDGSHGVSEFASKHLDRAGIAYG